MRAHTFKLLSARVRAISVVFLYPIGITKLHVKTLDGGAKHVE